MPNIPSQKQLNDLEFDRNFEKINNCKIIKSCMFSPINLPELKPGRNYYGEDQGVKITVHNFKPIINKYYLFRN